MGLGAPAVHAAAGPHPVGDPDRDYRPHRALAGGRYPQPGVYRWPARPRAQRVAHLCPCHEKCRAHRAGGDGAAGGLSDGRLDPCGDRFLWPGTGLLLNTAIFQRDLPLLQGTIWVLALFFVLLNLLVDILQTTLDPRIKRS